MCAVTDPLDHFAELEGRRLLVVGCGAPDVLAAAVRRGAVVWGVDDSPGRLATARDRVPCADLRLARLDELPFDTGTFDLVYSSAGVASVDLAAAVAEQVRVCRRTGVVVLDGGHESPVPPGSDSRY